jgi:hypothetical protein
MNYEDIGLNSHLQPIGAPITAGAAVDPFSFDGDYERGVINTSHVKFLSADQIGAGTVVVSINLGSSGAGSLVLDGANNRIIVHDGTVNRIVIGNV